MEEIIRHIQHALPNQEYLHLVNRKVLARPNSARLVDPFAPDIALDRALSAYVQREAVEAAISQPGCGVLLGRTGIGKTTLVRYFVKNIWATGSPSALIIPIPIMRIRSALPAVSFNEGKISILTSEKVATLIFGAFWNDFIVRQVSPQYFDALRKNYEWMSTLRTFYHTCGTESLPSEDFELLSWLQAKDSTSEPATQKTWEANLRSLLNFITEPEALEDIFGFSKPWPYPRVRLFIDGTEHFSGSAVQRLIQDAQQLYYSYGSYLDFKLFLDTTYDGIVRGLSCVQEGRVPLYEIPGWTRVKMRNLLAGRISTYLRSGDSGEMTDESVNTTLSEAARRLPLTPSAKAHFWSRILDEVPDSPESQGAAQRYPTPLQILRLTRGTLAAAAGCFTRYAPPLDTNSLNEIITAYWQAEQGQENRKGGVSDNADER